MTILPEKARSYLLLTVFAVITITGWFISRNNLGSDQSTVYLAIAFILSTIFIYRDHLFSIQGNNASSTDDDKNIRLGLNFQGLGKLDSAFALYKKCASSPKIISLMTNLAQDFEIINQRDKANEVYVHILSIDANDEFAKNKIASNVTNKQSISKKSSTLFNDRYKIGERLGKGTDSSVFLAQDHENKNQKVAIKILEINYSNKNDLDNELLARFEREAATAASLQHKNIIRVLDSGYADNVAYMAMEYVKGKSLRDHSHANTLLPLPLVVELIAQCADGLHYAHELGIIHRDVKPANILYDHATSTAKLGDFGIARIANSTQTLAGSFLGTPFYMSPEQLESHKIDERSDIFSLGATLYRLISGTPPFVGRSIADLMFKIVNQPHKDIRNIKSDLPSSLIQFIDKALAKEPDQRFTSAQEFSDELRKCI